MFLKILVKNDAYIVIKYYIKIKISKVYVHMYFIHFTSLYL